MDIIYEIIYTTGSCRAALKWSTDLWLWGGFLEVIGTMATLRLTRRAYTLHNPRKIMNASTKRALMQGKQSMYQHVGIQRDLSTLCFFSGSSCNEVSLSSFLVSLSSVVLSMVINWLDHWLIVTPHPHTTSLFALYHKTQIRNTQPTRALDVLSSRVCNKFRLWVTNNHDE